MPTWNQLPDGGDWLKHSQTPLSNSSSSLGNAKAPAQHTPSLPSRHSSSSSDSASAVERHTKAKQELNRHLPPEDRVALTTSKPSKGGQSQTPSHSANHQKHPSKPSGTMSPNAIEHRSNLASHSKPASKVSGTMSPNAIEHRSNLASHSKPSSKVSGTMSPNAIEHGSGSQHSSIKPKPIPGSADDLAEALKELQQRRDAEQSLRKANKGGIFGAELRDLQRDTSVAQARVDASEAAKKLQDFPTQARRSNLQNRGITEEIRSDLVQQANSAKEKYMGTQGLDVSGQPIKLIPPPSAPEPPKPKPEKSLWDRTRDFVTEKSSDALDKTKIAGNFAKDHASDIAHTGLDVVSVVPELGVIAGSANAALYLVEGDKENAGLSGAAALASLAGGGGAVMAVKYGAKAAKGVEKLAEAGTIVNKATNIADVAEGGINSVQYAMQGDWQKASISLASVGVGSGAGAKAIKKVPIGGKTHITYTLRNSDGTVRYAGRASGYGTPQEVLEKRLSLGEGDKKHHILKKHGEELKGGEARLEGVHSSKAAAEGGEDVLYSRYQVPDKRDIEDKKKGFKVIEGKKIDVIKHELKVKQITKKGTREVTMGGGANYTDGNKMLLNGQNPLSENSSKIRNPWTHNSRSLDKVTKDSGFEKIKAYAEDLGKPSKFGRVEYSRKLD